jgi:hypothetical protein
MINKIKDFLKKKLGRKATQDLSDQDELLADDAFESLDQTNPGFKVEPVRANEDATGEFNVSRQSLKDDQEIFHSEKTNLKEKLTYL